MLKQCTTSFSDLIQPLEKMFCAAVRSLLSTLCFLTFVFSASAKNDSLLKSIQVLHFTFENHKPVDNRVKE